MFRLSNEEKGVEEERRLRVTVGYPARRIFADLLERARLPAPSSANEQQLLAPPPPPYSSLGNSSRTFVETVAAALGRNRLRPAAMSRIPETPKFTREFNLSAARAPRTIRSPPSVTRPRRQPRHQNRSSVRPRPRPPMPIPAPPATPFSATPVFGIGQPASASKAMTKTGRPLPVQFFPGRGTPKKLCRTLRPSRTGLAAATSVHRQACSRTLRPALSILNLTYPAAYLRNTDAIETTSGITPVSAAGHPDHLLLGFENAEH